MGYRFLNRVSRVRWSNCYKKSLGLGLVSALGHGTVYDIVVITTNYSIQGLKQKINIFIRERAKFLLGLSKFKLDYTRSYDYLFMSCELPFVPVIQILKKKKKKEEKKLNEHLN